jgi:undecaprenyl-diphosphatase
MNDVPSNPPESRSRAGEFGLLAALAAVAGLLFAFVELVGDVAEGDTTAFDRAVLLALRNPADLSDPIGPWWLEVMFEDLTSLGGTSVLTLITLAALGYLLMDGKRAAALLVAVSVGGGTLLSTLLKLGFERPRPDLVAHHVDVFTASFPSGHAMLSAVTYLTLGALLARVQARRRHKIYLLALAAFMALLIGFSRIYLGVHWPTDVLAGWAAGAAWALLCWLVALWLQRRGQIEPAAETVPTHDDAASDDEVALPQQRQVKSPARSRG